MSYSVKQIPGHTIHRLGGGLIEVNIKAPRTGQNEPKVDHGILISILHSHNLIPPSHNEMFSSILSSPDLRKKLEGSFVYLRRMANLANLPNGFYLIEEGQEPGQLKIDQVTPGTIDPEKTVRIWKGKNPPALFTLTDEATAEKQSRFIIDMAISPSFSTKTVIGVEPNPLMVLRGGSGNLPPSLSPEITRAYRNAIAELNRIEQKLPNSTRKTRELLATLTRLNDWS